MNPTERLLEALRNHGHEPRKTGDGWACRCPAHEDTNPSLTIDIGKGGGVVWRRHAGCEQPAVIAAVGLTFRDLMPDSPHRANGRGTKPRPRAKHVAKVPTKDQDKPGPASEPMTTLDAAIAELDRRYGPHSKTWIYVNEASEPVGVTYRRNKPDGGKTIRHAWRTADAREWVLEGGPKPHPLLHLPDLIRTPKSTRVWVCEGERAVDAARRCGLIATTSAGGAGRAKGSDWSALAGHDVVMSVDRDKAGEDYGVEVVQLAHEVGARSVRVVRLADLWGDLPAGGDLVDLLEHRGDDVNVTRAEVEALADRAEPVALAAIKDAPVEEESVSQAEQLVRLALDQFRLAQTSKHEPFAVLNTGPNVASMLSGSGGSVRDLLAREYRRRHKRIMNQTAYADALATLRGEAIESECEAVYVRVGPFGDGVVMDLGTASGEAVVVDHAGWRMVARSPILFQRTALTGELPAPQRGGRLDALRELLNVTDATWPILLGWMVAALIPEMPHPILMLGGQQGTGKTSAARFVCGLFDPSDAPVRSQPRAEEAWAMGVANCWAAVIDNVSNIPDWWSDALCKVVTGDGYLRRTLYSNGDVSVLSFRRVIALTSIDAGALRGDLGERLVLVDLEPIEPSKRKTERELDAAYKAAKPAILGALLDLLVSVLGKIDSVRLPTLPRMADFARVLAAVDATLGTDSFAQFADQGKRIAGEVLDADPVGEAIARFARERGEWTGAANQLLREIKPNNAGREWPDGPRGLAAAIKRLIPALALHGVRVVVPRPNDRTRTYFLSATAQTAQPPDSGSSGNEMGNTSRAIAFPSIGDRPSNRPSCNRQPDAANAKSALLGGSGDPAHEIASAGDGWGKP